MNMIIFQRQRALVDWLAPLSVLAHSIFVPLARSAGPRNWWFTLLLLRPLARCCVGSLRRLAASARCVGSLG